MVGVCLRGVFPPRLRVRKIQRGAEEEKEKRGRSFFLDRVREMMELSFASSPYTQVLDRQAAPPAHVDRRPGVSTCRWGAFCGSAYTWRVGTRERWREGLLLGGACLCVVWVEEGRSLGQVSRRRAWSMCLSHRVSLDSQLARREDGSVKVDDMEGRRKRSARERERERERLRHLCILVARLFLPSHLPHC